MPRKILLDVGGFHGTSSLAGLDPLFCFDRIFCFEPSAVCCARIARIKDSRLVIVKAGLSDKLCQATLHNSGNLGASVYESAPTHGDEGRGATELVTLLNTADFFDQFLLPDDEVYIKLNCEGSEIDVLESLLTNVSPVSIKNILIDLDALKIPSQASRVKGVMERVNAAGLSYFTPEQVQYGMVTNFGGIRNWLIEACAPSNSLFSITRSLIFNAYVFFCFPECNGYHKMLALKWFPFLSFVARSRQHSFCVR